MRLPPAVGFTYELCAGIIDKPGLDLQQITREEVGWLPGLRCAEPVLCCAGPQPITGQEVQGPLRCAAAHAIASGCARSDCQRQPGAATPGVPGSLHSD